MKKIFSLLYIITIIVTPIAGLIPQAYADDNECKVLSAEWSPSGDQSNSFYKDGATKAYIITKTSGCMGKNITLTVYEADSCPLVNCDDALSDSGLLRRKLDIPSDNFTIPIRLGEEECETGLGYDCNLFFYIRENDNVLYNSWSRSNGQISYECDSLCNTNAQLVLPLISNSTKPADPKDLPTSIKPGEAGYIGSDGTYTLLAPLPGLDKIETNDIGKYFNIMFKIAIGACGVLAVIMIIINGISYMMTESFTEKAKLKGKIVGPIGGLMIAVGAYVILYTIDPALTGQNGLTVDQVTAEIEGDAQAPVTINSSQATSAGILCPKSGGVSKIPSIAKSFAGKMTYSQEIPKGQPGPNGTIKLDCSGFVNYVLKCAGVDNKKVNSGTSIIFNGSEKVDQNTITASSINGKALQVGDLIGWQPQDSPHGGHVMIYIGDGQVVNDSHGGSTNGVRHAPGKAYGSFPVTKYQSVIKWIRRFNTI